MSRISLVLLCIVFFSSTQIHAHNWRKQKLVLFTSYELTQDALNMSLCLPADLANILLKAPLDFNYILSEQVMGDVQQQLQDHFKEFQPIWIDGVRVFPQWDRIDYVLTALQDEVEATMQVLKDQSKDQNVAMHTGSKGAIIVRVTYPIKSASKEIKIHWKHPRLFTGETARKRPQYLRKKALKTPRKIMSGIFIYQDELSPIRFSPQEPEFIWRKPISKVKIPTLQQVQLYTPPSFAQPILALLILCLSMIFIVRSDKSIKEHFSTSYVYALMVVILLSAYFKPLQISFSSSKAVLSKIQCQNIFEALHQNIYRAFDYEDDSIIYDALSQSVSGDLLDWIFQKVYQSLILKDEGGAKAKITSVKPLYFEKLAWNQKDQSLLQGDQNKQNYFAVLYRWRTIGEVKHWGHSHRRVNEYEARYWVAYTKDGWRIVKSQAIAQNRRADLEGN